MPIGFGESLLAMSTPCRNVWPERNELVMRTRNSASCVTNFSMRMERLILRIGMCRNAATPAQQSATTGLCDMIMPMMPARTTPPARTMRNSAGFSGMSHWVSSRSRWSM